MSKHKVFELKTAGANVFSSRGQRRGRFYGSFHSKFLILDSVAYVGSANFTAASRANHETVLKLSGPPVAELRRHFRMARIAAKEL